MKITLLSHFYNEEYLLPWWLNHHKNIFDDAVLINYGSTDNSLNIIKDICPNWKVVNTRNDEFDSILVDDEVADYESTIEGFTLVLNTTEFLLAPHNFRDCLNERTNDTCYSISASYTMSDDNLEKQPTYDEPLVFQKHFGHWDWEIRRTNRFLHNYKIKGSIGVGRHHSNVPTVNLKDFNILWYRFCPWNEKMIHRNLQIGPKVSIRDKQNRIGHRHYGWDLNFQDLKRKELLLKAIDLKPLLNNIIL